MLKENDGFGNQMSLTPPKLYYFYPDCKGVIDMNTNVQKLHLDGFPFGLVVY